MRLTSWKEIAAHVGRDVRTVLRWHKERGLPVHRAPGGRKGSVFAFTEELDAWLTSASRHAPAQPFSPPAAPTAEIRRPLHAVIAVFLSAAAIGGAVLAAISVPRDAVARVSLAGGSLVAENAAGARIWSHALGVADPVLAARKSFVSADLDGDGSAELIVAVRHRDPASGAPQETLLCFDARGALRWQSRLTDRIRFGAGEFGPPWRAEDLAVVETPRGPRVAVAVHHDVWWPSFVAALDADGRVDSRFVHAGWLTRLEAAPDRHALIAAGFNNDLDAAVLTILNGQTLTGHGPSPRDHRYSCLDCPGTEPARYFTFPRTEVNRALGLTPLDDHLVVQADGSIVLRVGQDRYNGAVEALYEIGPDDVVRRASVSDDYWNAHRKLERDGRIGHPVELCPEQKGLPFR